MLKRSFICCYTTCMSVPLNQEHILFITLLAINKYFFCVYKLYLHGQTERDNLQVPKIVGVPGNKINPKIMK